MLEPSSKINFIKLHDGRFSIAEVDLSSHKMITLKDDLDTIIYTASIVTLLKEIGVKRVQITLDGSKESHDKRRILLNGEGSFNKIIDNIENYSKGLNYKYIFKLKDNLKGNVYEYYI